MKYLKRKKTSRLKIYFLSLLVIVANNLLAAQKPNVVFILSDDMGYETNSYNQAKNYHTPNLDALAFSSTVFTNCDAQPLCVPSRVKILTGQHNYRNYKGWTSFDLEFLPLGQMMKEAGYVTGAFGKWHVSKKPEQMGFDSYSLFDGSPGKLSYSEFLKRYHYNCPLIEDGGPYVAHYSPDRFSERALRFIEDNKEKPFFLYYPMSLAHNPFEPTPDSKSRTTDNWQQNFEDMVAYADKLIGKLINKLKETGVYDNTIIIYTSDNGTKTLAHYMENGLTIYGQKGVHTFDGTHVPLFIKYDGKHRTVSDLVDFSDFYPTLADFAGYATKKIEDKLDGVSLTPVLKGKSRKPKPYIFSMFMHPLSAYIRDQRFKLYYDGRLYDLLNDPRETKPYYSLNDIPETQPARKKLVSQLTELLENSNLSAYPSKQKLRNKFGDYRTPPTNHFLLGCFLFDGLTYTPTLKKISIDITPFLNDTPSSYQLQFSRNHNASSSGLYYADAAVSEIKIFKNDVYQKSIKAKNIVLTTRIDHAKLKETGNPYISFLTEGDGKNISIGPLHCTKNEKIKLEISVTLSNPQNQWGDRLSLYAFLEKEN